MNSNHQKLDGAETPKGQPVEPVESDLIECINQPWLAVRRIQLIHGKEPLQAFAVVAVGDIIINGCPIFQSPGEEPSTHLPATKGKGGIRHPVVECAHPILERRICALILDAWRKLNEPRRAV